MSETLNREYHEKLGWRIADAQRHPNDGYGSGFYKGHTLLSPKGEERCFMTTSTPSKLWESLPNLHTDANLCIAELYRVFQDWYVRVEHIDDPASEFHGKKTILVTGENFNREKDDWEPSCSGHSIGNFCEAALKCLIAAHKRESEAV